jgi:hypothetical protein
MGDVKLIVTSRKIKSPLKEPGDFRKGRGLLAMT